VKDESENLPDSLRVDRLAVSGLILEAPSAEEVFSEK
jgi:hypothetical protein